MKEVPAEILREMFESLTQKELVVCMTVCKAWNSAITQFLLFRSIRITNINQLEKVKRKFQQTPSLGELVERIHLNLDISRGTDLDSFLELFPNPKAIYTPAAVVSQVGDGWRDSLEVFWELSGCQTISRLLVSNVFVHLETIVVYRDSFDISARTFIDKLINAPSLKRLRMKHFSLEMDDLESLHTTLPQLQSLDFDLTSLFGYHSLPAGIQPTDSVTSFTIELHCIDITETAINLLEYIGKKYRSLIELKVYLVTEDINYDDSDSLFKDGLIPLLRNLGPQLKTVGMFLETDARVLFNTLDLVDYQLESLDIQLLPQARWTLEEPIITKQQRHLKSLKLTALFPVTFKWLSDFTVLNELNLIFSYMPKRPNTPRLVTLNRILDSCPETLTSITLANATLIYESSNIHLPFIKKMCLRDCILRDGLDGFVSRALPQLHDLRMDYCQLAYRHLSFPGLHLFHLEINDIYKVSKDTLLVKILENGEQRLYEKSPRSVYNYHEEQSAIGHDNALYPTSKSIPISNTFRLRPLISIECASVKTIRY